MKKIIYITSTLKVSGPTNQLYNIIANLDRSIFEPVLITLSPETQESKWKEYEELNIEMYSLSLSRVCGLFLAQSRLARLVDVLKPDLIHTQGARADVLSSRLKYRVLKVSTVRNFPQYDYRMTYGAILGRYLTFIQTNAFKKIDLCCCVSKAVSVNLLDCFRLHNSRVVHNGVDDKYYSRIDSDLKLDLRKKLSLPGDSVIWLSSIGKDKRKNSDFIVKEFLAFMKDKPHHYLVFIGDGELSAECKVLSSGEERIVYYGRTNNVKRFLQASDYFISASKAEGLPNAVLEAMACGLPCLLSDIPPHVELSRLCSDGISLFSLKDKSLTKRLHDASASELIMKSDAVLNAVQEFFSCQNMSLSYQKIYMELNSGGKL